MRASNRFGETLLHVACRRGRTSMVRFFLSSDAEEEGNVNSTLSASKSKIPRVEARVRDDLGRTPMHDLCWSSANPDHGSMALLVRAAPELLLAKDARGFSPFDYARREHWPSWLAFLKQYEEFVVGCLVHSSFARLQLEQKKLKLKLQHQEQELELKQQEEDEKEEAVTGAGDGPEAQCQTTEYNWTCLVRTYCTVASNLIVLSSQTPLQI